MDGLFLRLELERSHYQALELEDKEVVTYVQAPHSSGEASNKQNYEQSPFWGSTQSIAEDILLFW